MNTLRHLLEWRVPELSAVILSALYSAAEPTTGPVSCTAAPAAALSPAESSASGAGSNGPRLKRERLTPEEFAQHLRLRPDSLALHSLLRAAALDFGPSGVSTLASPPLEADAQQRSTGVGEVLAVSHAALSFLVAAASTPIALFTGTSCEPSAMDAGQDGLATRSSISQQQQQQPLLDSHAFGDFTDRLFTGLREVLNLCAFSRLQQTLASNGQQNGCASGEAAFDHQKSPRKRTRKLQENGTSGRAPNGGSSTPSPAPDIVLSTLLQSAQVALAWSELQRQPRSNGQPNAAAVSGSSCAVNLVAPGCSAPAEIAGAQSISAYLVELLEGARSLPILLARVPECHEAAGTLPSNQHFQPARLLSRTIIALTEFLFTTPANVHNSGESILVDEIVRVHSLRRIVQSVNMQ